MRCVCHAKGHMCAQYGLSQKTYVTISTVTLVMWLDSQETSYMIAHFREHLFQIVHFFHVYNF